MNNVVDLMRLNAGCKCAAEEIYQTLDEDKTEINLQVKELVERLQKDFQGFRLVPKTIYRSHWYLFGFSMEKTVYVPVTISIRKHNYDGEDSVNIEYGNCKVLIWRDLNNHESYDKLLKSVVTQIKQYIHDYKK